MKRLISMTGAAALLAGALLLPAALRAEDKDKKDAKPEAHEEGGRRGAWLKEKLGITDEQEGKLKTIKRAHREAEEAARSELGAIMRKLSDQLEDKASEKDLSASLDKLKAAHKAMGAEREKFMDSMAQVLTPTQRAKMAVGMMRHMRGGPGGRGMGHGRGGKMRGERGEHEDMHDSVGEPEGAPESAPAPDEDD